MERSAIGSIKEIIAYVETHLGDQLNLETVAAAAHYSKYHLCRMFVDITGITLHDYIRRRQLTEAAKLLVFSDKPILEAALAAGYESQQAFTDVFRAMYKQPPLRYRRNGKFYPLQLEFDLYHDPSAPDRMVFNISYAMPEDIPAWMGFVPLVIDGFPCFDETMHRRQLERCVEQRQALLLWDKAVVAGAAAVSRQSGSIDFLAVHPQYRQHGIERVILDFIVHNLLTDREISITTFREGDKADTGQRLAYQRLGFVGTELSAEFGYPTQRMVLYPGREVFHE